MLRETEGVHQGVVYVKKKEVPVELQADLQSYIAAQTFGIWVWL